MIELYSKEVMNHFLKPRHAGEIKGADGVGVVGNPVCLPTTSLIVANPNLREIDSLSRSEHVLGHDGHFHKIEKVMSRKYAGSLISITNCFGETLLTPEHEVLAVRVPKTHWFKYFRNKKKLPVEWVEAGSLSLGDLCVYPVLQVVRDVSEISTNLVCKKFDYKSEDIPSKIPVNSEFLRLAGYFLSEGHIKLKTGATQTAFTFSAKETIFADDVVKIVKDLFGIKAKKKLIAHRNTLVVLVYNVHFARFFKSLFGNGAAEKSIPHSLMLLPPEKQKELINGLWRGDGFINKKIPRGGYATISAKLAEQLKTLLLRQGIVPSLYFEKAKKIKGVNHRGAYRLHVGRQGVEKISKIVGKPLHVSKDKKIRAWVSSGYAYLPVTAAFSSKFNGRVHNLSVEKAQSYLTPSLTVHNCGDKMVVYIKVSGNKIKKIKFKTFGCAAAIATSDMICDLAVGKTLDDAKRITRDEVADALGKLPLIKMHCSNLAADALKKAIEDFESKKQPRLCPP